MLRGTVDRVRFQGAALTSNALGDPVERELIVYVPPSYADDTRSGRAARRYPLVMVLPGFAATNSSLLNFKPWEPNLFERYERLLADGCGEAILVLPDCFTRLGGSQYVDSAAQGNYQTYLADDVLTLVDARYRTLGTRGSRAIIGKSSGGFGALRMGFDRPERFAVIASHAGDCAFELTVRGRFTEVLPVYEKHGGPAGFLAALADRAPRSQSEFHALEMLALAHAYADGELPVDPYTATLIPERWQRWLAADPVVLATAAGTAKSAKTLKDARLVFLDAGRSDEYGLQFGARILASQLRSAGAAVEHQEFDGGHMGTGYRYEVSLPKIIAALDTPLDTHDSMSADRPRSALAEDEHTAHTKGDASGSSAGSRGLAPVARDHARVDSSLACDDARPDSSRPTPRSSRESP